MSVNNIGGNIGGIGDVRGVQGPDNADISDKRLSLADRTTLVMLEKASVLEGQVNAYIDRVHEQNQKLKQLGEIQSKLRNMQSTTNTVDSPTWTADHSATPKQINLDNGYSIEIPGKGQSWTIRDANGNETRIWGDPHVSEGDVEGDRNWDFQEDATFVLGDGTKIHVAVKDLGGVDGVVTDSLTITKGNQSIEITGIAENDPQIGNPELRGAELDRATNDGHVFTMGDQADDWVHAQGDTTKEIASDGWVNVTEELGAIESEGVAGVTDGIGDPDDGNINNVLTDSDLALLRELGVEVFDQSNLGSLTPTELKNLDASINAAKDTMTSISQLEMVKLQSYNGKYEQTNALASQVMKTQYQEAKSIIRNI